MARRTKSSDDRIEEVKDTIEGIGGDIPYRLQLVTRIDQELLGMNNNAKRQLSRSLHLQKQHNKQVRDYVRALMFLELVFNDAPRTPAQISTAYINSPQFTLRSDLRAVVRNLDPTFVPPDLGRHRPICIGVSISGGMHPGPGSITCFVRCRDTNRIMVLGNQHVMKAEHGNLQEYEPEIFQPSLGNGAGPADQIGVWDRGILDNRIDASVAYLDDGVEWINRTPEGIVLAATNPVVQVNDRVWKRGTASRRTEGRVIDVNRTSTVPHARFGGDITFTQQIEVMADEGPFQIPGDSGSALWNDNDQLIGVMHGGGDNGGGLATPIGVVFDLLNVELP